MTKRVGRCGLADPCPSHPLIFGFRVYSVNWNVTQARNRPGPCCYRGPYFRPVRELIPPSIPRGTSFAAPIRVL